MHVSAMKISRAAMQCTPVRIATLVLRCQAGRSFNGLEA